MRKGTTVEAALGSEWSGDVTLDDLAREGARRLIEIALRLEVDEYVSRYHGVRDGDGHALVVRNGAARPRPITGGAGTVTLAAPRVNDRRVVEGQRQKFTSRILPPYLRRSPNVAGVLPLLYLRGLSTGDFREALPTLLGPRAAGLSPSTITRLTQAWTAEYTAFRSRDLADWDYVYLWAEGIHFNIRLEDERLPGRALEASAEHQPDRVDVRDRAAAPACHEGRGLANRGAHDGLQAARGRGRALAPARRARARAVGPRRGPVRRWRPGGTRGPGPKAARSMTPNNAMARTGETRAPQFTRCRGHDASRGGSRIASDDRAHIRPPDRTLVASPASPNVRATSSPASRAHLITPDPQLLTISLVGRLALTPQAGASKDRRHCRRSL